MILERATYILKCIHVRRIDAKAVLVMSLININHKTGRFLWYLDLNHGSCALLSPYSRWNLIEMKAHGDYLDYGRRGPRVRHWFWITDSRGAHNHIGRNPNHITTRFWHCKDGRTTNPQSQSDCDHGLRPIVRVGLRKPSLLVPL